jgi:hypothetical protein
MYILNVHTGQNMQQPTDKIKIINDVDSSLNCLQQFVISICRLNRIFHCDFQCLFLISSNTLQKILQYEQLIK